MRDKGRSHQAAGGSRLAAWGRQHTPGPTDTINTSNI